MKYPESVVIWLRNIYLFIIIWLATPFWWNFSLNLWFCLWFHSNYEFQNSFGQKSTIQGSLNANLLGKVDNRRNWIPKIDSHLHPKKHLSHWRLKTASFFLVRFIHSCCDCIFNLFKTIHLLCVFLILHLFVRSYGVVFVSSSSFSASIKVFSWPWS